jgi:putative flippase GtrA
MLLTQDRAPRGDRLEALKFCLVGAGGYAVNTCAFALSVALGSQELIAATAAFLVSVGAFLFGAGVLELLTGAASLPSLPAQAASIVAATPLNFLGNKAWSFAA